jgi:putative addiction module killer protein
MTNTINQTHDFSVWLLGVTDVLARAAILVRIKRAAPGNFGDCHDVGSSVWEMRITQVRATVSITRVTA